ncbi:DUF4190 domain-containing protein [Streptomyces sp. NBC_00083]|uniref:DUF4190 domain-containing protein n=1 Tax=Streptomyces sp. NBC_00083 TaxID=2975647 RepID=UPI002252C2E5|nr:DUF4190 domain-containing protein [Streptomyces sp. NBC_00083]MCX5384341.1 DUF4190 domain-containing protein [Streptomyces sp. NBC_00083]
MSTTAGERPKNRAVDISATAAVLGVMAATGSLATGTLFLPLTVGWVILILLSSLVAIVSGHIGRRRARRRGLPGRGLALAAIVTAYLTLLYVLFVLVLLIGLLAGLGAVFGG